MTRGPILERQEGIKVNIENIGKMFKHHLLKNKNYNATIFYITMQAQKISVDSHSVLNLDPCINEAPREIKSFTKNIMGNV